MSAKEWYLRQSQRDRMIVIGLVLLVVLSLFYALIWHPLVNGLERNRSIVVKNESVIRQMREAEMQVMSLRGNGTQVLKKTDKAPYLLIDEIIRRLGMSNPDRVEPIGASGARVNFSSVEFDKLILAIGELEQYGLQISTLNVSRKDQGMVGARFRVDKNG